jgi:primosomal protein N' (replication factor Y)
LYQVLQQNLSIPVLGPEEPAIGRIRNEYIRTIMVKIPNETSLQITKKTILRVLNSFDLVSQYRTIKVTVNVDFN